jgi:hypothetical protein
MKRGKPIQIGKTETAIIGASAGIAQQHARLDWYA